MTLTTTNKTATPTIRKRTNMMIFMMTSILIYHHLSSIITYHHLSSSIITYHHLSSPIITYHHLSSIIYHLSSIIYHLSSIIYHLSSIIYHLSSIIYHQRHHFNRKQKPKNMYCWMHHSANVFRILRSEPLAAAG